MIFYNFSVMRDVLMGAELIFVSQTHMGVSENSVSLNPMVNDHYPY